jgi:hypothetical protein
MVVVDFVKRRKRRNNNNNNNNNHGRKEQIGLSLLGSISAFSIWSAVNPSFFTIKAFTTKEQEKNVRFGMNIGVVLTLALAAALWFAYGKKGLAPALLTAGTGIGLWFTYRHMLKETLSSSSSSSS